MPTVPSLVGINVQEKDIFALEGLSLKNVKVSAFSDNKCLYSSPVGEMLFTSGGVSGPIVLSLSAHINRIEPTNIKLYIDFKPALSLEQLEGRISRDISSLGAKQVSSLLEGLLPKSLCGVFAHRLGFLLEEKANQVDWKKEDSRQWYVLFSVHGFTEELQQLAEQREDVQLYS